MSISIGIPIYNAEQYLHDALRSVFAQTYQDWELILIDDGSSDRSLDIAKSVSDPRVKVISDGQNRKLPYRLNQIVSEARYQYIARMDADDLISPFRLERQLAVLIENPQIDIVSTGVCSLSNNNLAVGVRAYSTPLNLTLSDVLRGQSGIVHASVLARRSWYLRNRYDVEQVLTEDYELWVRAFVNNDLKLNILSEPLYYYREEGNVTAAKLLRAYSSQRILLKKYFWENISYRASLSMYINLYAKSALVLGLSSMGLLQHLRANRNSPINDSTVMSHFNAELSIIRNTRVPGLD